MCVCAAVTHPNKPISINQSNMFQMFVCLQRLSCVGPVGVDHGLVTYTTAQQLTALYSYLSHNVKSPQPSLYAIT